MPFYNQLKYDFRNKKKRDYVVDKLIKLKNQSKAEIPDKDADENLLLATWNIRDFDKRNRRGFGKRTIESLYFIAEIISSFDIVAVQEVNRLQEWRKVMKILGPSWDYIATDVSDSRAGGNGERMVFVYDKRKVWFQNIAGEIVLPKSLLISNSEITDTKERLASGKQFRRTPYIVSFQSGWFKFDLCTVHIYYGKGTAGLKQRIQEIERIASYLSKRVDKAMENEFKSTILLGDFNILRPDHETMKALINNGFKVPKKIQSIKANVKNTFHYDQIAFKTNKGLVEHVDKPSSSPKNSNAGEFEIMKSVFQNIKSDYEHYLPELKKSANSKNKTDAELRKYYDSEWRTYQMSDHNLIWVRLQTNDGLKYLDNLKSTK